MFNNFFDIFDIIKVNTDRKKQLEKQIKYDIVLYNNIEDCPIEISKFLLSYRNITRRYEKNMLQSDLLDKTNIMKNNTLKVDNLHKEIDNEIDINNFCKSLKKYNQKIADINTKSL